MKELKSLIIFISLLLFVSMSTTYASVSPYDFWAQQRNTTNDGYFVTLLPIPSSSGNGIIGINGSTSISTMMTFGNRISWNSGTGAINVDTSNIPESDITNLTSDLSSKISNITGLITAGSGVSISGSGTSGSPYSISGTATGTVTSITAGTGLSGGTITTSGTISMPNTGTAGTYSGVTTDAQGRVTSGTTASDSYTSRSLNSCFQVSSTRNSLVNYSVDISSTLSITAGQSGTVTLNTYTDSGCTTGTQEINEFTNANTGTLTIGLSTTQNVTGTLTGFIPSGKYIKLVTTNNTGTPTFTFKSSQEVQL